MKSGWVEVPVPHILRVVNADDGAFEDHFQFCSLELKYKDLPKIFKMTNRISRQRTERSFPPSVSTPIVFSFNISFALTQSRMMHHLFMLISVGETVIYRWRDCFISAHTNTITNNHKQIIETEALPTKVLDKLIGLNQKQSWSFLQSSLPPLILDTTWRQPGLSVVKETSPLQLASKKKASQTYWSSDTGW